MDIAVCVKTNPDLQLMRVKDRVPVLEAVPFKVGDLEKNALEAALGLRDAAGQGRIVAVAVSQGDRKLRETMKEALAIGADEAVLVCDPALDDTDQAGVALALARALEKAGLFELVLFGEGSTDGYSGEVPSRVAELLGLPRSATRARSRSPARSCAPSAAWARTWRPSRPPCRRWPPW